MNDETSRVVFGLGREGQSDNVGFLLKHWISLAAALVVLVPSSLLGTETNWLSSLDLSQIDQSWGTARPDTAVGGSPLMIAGEGFKHGIGTHAISFFRLNLNGYGLQFSAKVGVDDETGGGGSVEFMVIGDGRTLWESGKMIGRQKAKACRVDLTGINELLLEVGDAGDGIDADHADWADAQIVMMHGKPGVLPAHKNVVKENAIILTPAPRLTPRINGARIFGVRPGSPFLFTIPATGERPIFFEASGLPQGLNLDAKSGRITGKLKSKGEWTVILRAKNAKGETQRDFRIVCGDTIALTPPMGWNSWNCFADSVSEDKVKAEAYAMVTNGLINHGWTYVNVDDFWQNNHNSNDPTLRGPFRDAQGNIIPNSRFLHMKGLADYIHSLGLKAGLYSSPGPWTCGGCTGSWKHEQQDARQYARWGFDYLKYDWCSYGEIAPKNPSLAEMKKPYQVMHAALDALPHDIVFSLCQYGMGRVWEWGAEPSVGGNCWRTTGDIVDTWSSISANGFSQAGLEKYAGPGHWNDPDMLVVGYLGWSANLRPTRLTPNEQYTHISLWCLLSAPLLIGCDMTTLDNFTLSLLCNDEVLAIDQDSLGKQASRIKKDGLTEVWAKDLSDGSKAVGLFNRGEEQTRITVKWLELGIQGNYMVRDLWRQQDVGRFSNEFSALVPRHGVVLVKLNR